MGGRGCFPLAWKGTVRIQAGSRACGRRQEDNHDFGEAAVRKSRTPVLEQ